MKVIIDLIEELRQSIANQEHYTLSVGLLKPDLKDDTKLHYAGEAPLHHFEINTQQEQLLFTHHTTKASPLKVEALLPSLMILEMSTMMYPLRITLNEAYKDLEVVGFGKNDEEGRFILFIAV